MTHAHHYGLPGFDGRQILHDGCPECEHRGASIERALGELDHVQFERAWRRAYDRFATSGDRERVGAVSVAEFPLLTALWGVMVQLERRGIPLNGEPPGLPVLTWMEMRRGMPGIRLVTLPMAPDDTEGPG